MKRIVLDVECYPNYFLALFTDERGRSKGYEIFEDDSSEYDRDAIYALINNPEIELVTFNGNSYDLPMLMLSLVGEPTYQLKVASDDIIVNNTKPWKFYRKHGIREPRRLNHIDLIEVSPGMASLKIYGGRLHTDKLQDLPVEPSTTLTREQASAVRRYCKNDTAVTWDLLNELSPQINLREIMSKQYGVDLRSKSDAQIAEAVLKVEYERFTGVEPTKTQIGYSEFRYEPPKHIRFITEELDENMDKLRSAVMVIKPTGHVQIPPEITKMVVTIGSTRYKIGLGGLHSQESEASHYADEGHTLQEWDVESYYPQMMLNMGMSPGPFGSHFPTIYGEMLKQRLEAKHAGDDVAKKIEALEKELACLNGKDRATEIKTELVELKRELVSHNNKSASIKISLNSTFGKTSSRYSLLYEPSMMILTTITGQLSMLMLIEALELCGIPVVSANTDGIVVRCPVKHDDLMVAIVSKWEKHTNLKTKKTEYLSLHSRDVNNYIAIEQGKVKTKGIYAKTGLMKNPQNVICAEAVVAYLRYGVPVEDTVRGSTDIRKFITLRTVNGGAFKEGYDLGKVIRWYYAEGVAGEITYKTNGNVVPRSDGAKPLMDLPDDMPDDINYEWYLTECNEMLMGLGIIERPFIEKLPRKNSNAWKGLRDDGKIKEGKKGKWEWV